MLWKTDQIVWTSLTQSKMESKVAKTIYPKTEATFKKESAVWEGIGIIWMTISEGWIFHYKFIL